MRRQSFSAADFSYFFQALLSMTGGGGLLNCKWRVGDEDPYSQPAPRWWSAPRGAFRIGPRSTSPLLGTLPTQGRAALARPRWQRRAYVHAGRALRCYCVTSSEIIGVSRVTLLRWADERSIGESGTDVAIRCCKQSSAAITPSFGAADHFCRTCRT